jgi:D-beta-D-heptose 7-phosphate kinase/D-beta-D-heptose 1-phosphate adenosyltransferase
MRDIATDLLDLQAASVFVAGDALLDVYVTGGVERISPEAPVPVVHESSERSVLGGAANVAANVAALGARVRLGARIGMDGEGEALRALCGVHGIGTQALVTDPALPTTRKTRVLAGYQQVVRLDREVVAPLGEPEVHALLASVDAWLEEEAGAPRALVLADYAKGVLTEEVVRALMARCALAGVPVIVDPKDPDLRRFRGATVLKPNRDEARRAALRAGTPTDEPRPSPARSWPARAQRTSCCPCRPRAWSPAARRCTRPSACPLARCRWPTSPAPATRWSRCWPWAVRRACRSSAP